MKSLLTVDPGVNGCGLAVWDVEGELLDASYLKNPDKTKEPWTRILSFAATLESVFQATLDEGDRVIVEMPRIYPGGGKGDPEDILRLGVLAGITAWLAVSHECGAVDAWIVRPQQWKGTVKKEVMTSRIQKQLTPEETALVRLPCASMAHNVWDAVGIGLWYFKRGIPK